MSKEQDPEKWWNVTVEEMSRRPRLYKQALALLHQTTRPSGIKRTRKRQIAKARWMMAEHDHTCYEWSQWWHKTARKPKGWK